MTWVLLFAGGLLGSAHCVGMCGGFVLTLGSTRPGLVANVYRQLAYGLGRVFTYAAVGAVAGFGGWRLSAQTRSLVNTQAALCLIAGVLLVGQSLIEMGVFPRVRSRAGGCLGPGMFGALLRATRLRSVFLGGVINGLLPCGLVYAYLALAAGAGDMVRGTATMLCFGLGTLPLMIATGCSGTLLSGRRRHGLLRIAAWCVLLTGALTIVRGIGFLHLGQPAPCCPLCE